MKSLNLNDTVLPFVCIVTALCCFSAQAQQLPNTQTVSVIAPPNVKIDGKFTEWGGLFEAYNKGASLYYIMANDNESLYLVVQSIDTGVISKIRRGGITLIVKTLTKNGNVPPLSLVFPVANKLTTTLTSQIKVTGITSIAQTVIPANNDYGIAAACLNDNKTYTCELSISIKYLLPIINSMGTFSYAVKVNDLNTFDEKEFSARYTLVKE